MHEIAPFKKNSQGMPHKPPSKAWVFCAVRYIPQAGCIYSPPPCLNIDLRLGLKTALSV